MKRRGREERRGLSCLFEQRIIYLKDGESEGKGAMGADEVPGDVGQGGGGRVRMEAGRVGGRR